MKTKTRRIKKLSRSQKAVRKIKQKNKKQTRKFKKLFKKVIRKSRKAKAPTLTEEQKAEAQAIADFNAEEKLSGWKTINKTWTKGKIARFKAAGYVKDLQNRIKDLQKKIVVFS